MTEWTSGYVVDVNYTHGFYRELSPAHLTYMCLLQGVQPPGRGIDPLTYCELGCGQGVTANLLAAANPHVQFFATDFNPSHIAGARSLAQAAKLKNIQLADDSFVEFLERKDLPDFDFITLHGIYSWITPDNRRAIVRFIRERLKPGGVVYISYNTMPGWSAVLPLRRLLLEHAASMGSRPRTTTIAAALEFVNRLSDLKARYFTSQPQLAARLKDLEKKDQNYVAHEYFNSELNPFYFMDVAKELAEAKLTWVGSAAPLEIADELHLSPEQVQLLSEIDDPDFRQTVRDHIVNQQFRRDIFVKGPLRLSKTVAMEESLDLRFVLSCQGSEVPKQIEGSRANVTINAELLEAMISAFGNGPRSVGDALSDPGLARLSPAELMRGINYLVGHGSCQPCLPEHGLAERQVQTGRLNMAIADQARHGGKVNYLASSVTGSGIRADRITQLLWLGLQRNEKDVVQFVWKTLVKAGHRLVKDGENLATEDENLAEIRLRYADFESRLAPVWANLGMNVGSSNSGVLREQRLIA